MAPHRSAGLGTTYPALPVRDVPAALAFYAEHLGFRATYASDDLAFVARDEATLMLWAATDERWRERPDLRERPVASGGESFLAGTASCRIAAADVDALLEELEGSPALHPASRGGVEATDHGTRELHARDADGNLLTFVGPGAAG